MIAARGGQNINKFKMSTTF